MSRLESFIRRLDAQRLCLDWAASEVGARPGAVLELGLGNGRTFDHLRARLGAGREIYAFDRQLAAHPGCVPPAGRLVLGELRETLPRFAARGLAVAMIHADLGSGDSAATAAQAAWLAAEIAAAGSPGCLVLSDQALRDPRLAPLPLPEGVPAGRYFAYLRG
jgi:hypothetical protein